MNTYRISPKAFLLLLFVLPVVLTGCELFGGEDDDEPTLVTTGVIVGNGGNFGDQNGFVTVYDPETGEVAHFDDAGAFLVSVALEGDRVYATLNTFSTGRVDVYSLAANARVGQIQEVPIPRFLAFVDTEKAYVTNWSFGGNGSVIPLNLQTNEIAGDPLEVGAFPEGIVVVDEKAFVANNGSSGAGTTLSVINTQTDRVTGTIELGCDGPKDLMVDAEDEIVVVCHGKTVFSDDFSEILEQTNAQVVFVNPSTETVVTRIPLNLQVGGTNGTQAATYAATAEEAYIIAGGANQIFRVNTDRNTLAATLDVPAADGLTALSGIAYDATSERLYVGRFPINADGSTDFTSAGSVVVLDRSGARVDAFQAGSSISHIVLRQDER